MTFAVRLTVLVGVALGLPPAARAQEKNVSAELRRFGYEVPAGAELVGDAVPSARGDAVAFFEHNDRGYELVVCIAGALPARWPVTRAISGLHIYWTGSEELVLGEALLKPRAKVRWRVARS